MLIGAQLTHNARNIPDREALVFGAERYDWRTLNERVNRCANALQRFGLQPGDRVVYVMPNRTEFIEIFYALAKLGVTGGPIVPQSVGADIAYVANDLGAKLIIADAANVPGIREVEGELETVQDLIGVGEGHGCAHDLRTLMDAASSAEPETIVDPDSILTMKYTSGTTGRSKGCMRTHRQFTTTGIINLIHMHETHEDRATISTPLAAGAALSYMTRHVMAGTTLILMPKFDATGLLEAIEREKVTIAYANGAVFNRFTDHPDLGTADLSSVKSLAFSTSSPTADVAHGLRKVLGNNSFNGVFLSAFASSEAGGRVTFLMPEDCAAALSDPAKAETLRSIGREAVMMEVACLDDDMRPVPPGEVGQLCVRGPAVFAGYWNRPEETEKAFRDGWFLTGDLARKDDTGLIYLVGRMRDVIRTGGMNVYPAEVEPVLMAQGQILEAALVGVPDAQWGEKVVACVVAEPGVTEDTILAWCRDRLAGHKRPKAVRFFDALPRNASDKIVKRLLQEQLIAEQSDTPAAE